MSTETNSSTLLTEVYAGEGSLFHPPSTLNLPKIHPDVIPLAASPPSNHYWLPFRHIQLYVHSLPPSIQLHAQPSFR